MCPSLISTSRSPSEACPTYGRSLIVQAELWQAHVASTLFTGFRSFGTPAAETPPMERPAETRPAVIRALRTLRNKRQTLPPKKHGNIPL